MYVYQDGKLYSQLGENKIIGVEIYPDKIIKIKGTEVEQRPESELMTPTEMKIRFQIVNGESYIFPREEVKSSEPVIEDEKPVRKRTRK